MSAVVRVAVGVLRDRLGRVLIALRPSYKHQGDLWEFPGGKIEASENVEDALRRELFEELGVTVRRSVPLVTVPFSYSDKAVLLEVREVVTFEGEPCGNEGQTIRWASVNELDAYKFPAANIPILKAVRLPELVCITGGYSDIDEFQRRIQRAISLGVGMAVLRPADRVRPSLQSVRMAIDSCRQVKLPLVLNSVVDQSLWKYGDGVHLRAEDLDMLQERPVDKSKLLGASCHNLQEAERAQALKVDYIFLSPVLQTESHPGLEGMGWSEFSSIAGQLHTPAYALGGMRCAHLMKARQSGAKGIAGISGFWE